MARRRIKYPKSSKYSTRRGRRSGGPGIGPVVVVLLLVAAGIWFIPRMKFTKTPSDLRVPAGAQALADSADANTKRGDWDAALFYAQQLASSAPKLSGAQRKLSVAWHNYGTGVRTIDGAPRSAQRTSIDKINCDIRSLAAADSARALAANDEEWLAAAELYGKTLEYLGLPLDAIGVYAQMLQKVPGHPGATQRVIFLRERLKNPLISDS